MRRPESLAGYGAFFSFLFLFALIFFWAIDRLDSPPSPKVLRPISGTLLQRPKVVTPSRSPSQLVLVLDSITVVVQNFEYLPNKKNAETLQGLQKGVHLTVYQRSDTKHLGGPCDIWAIQNGEEEILSLGEVVEAQNLEAIRRYKILAAFLAASIIVWFAGVLRRPLRPQNAA